MTDHSALIKSEIQAVSAMWSSPFRKGIVAGLKARLGRKPDKNPYPQNGPQSGRAHRNWRDGYVHGLVLQLPLPSAPNQAKVGGMSAVGRISLSPGNLCGDIRCL